MFTLSDSFEWRNRESSVFLSNLYLSRKRCSCLAEQEKSSQSKMSIFCAVNTISSWWRERVVSTRVVSLSTICSSPAHSKSKSKRVRTTFLDDQLNVLQVWISPSDWGEREREREREREIFSQVFLFVPASLPKLESRVQVFSNRIALRLTSNTIPIQTGQIWRGSLS